jgi:hypothetical protein
VAVRSRFPSPANVDRPFPPPQRFRPNIRDAVQATLGEMLTVRGRDAEGAGPVLEFLERTVDSYRNQKHRPRWSRVGTRARALQDALAAWSEGVPLSLGDILRFPPDLEWRSFASVLDVLAKLPSGKPGRKSPRDEALRGLCRGVIDVLRDAELPTGRNVRGVQKILVAVRADVLNEGLPRLDDPQAFEESGRSLAARAHRRRLRRGGSRRRE